MYKQENTFDNRIKVSKKFLEKYPDRIPVIVEKAQSSNIPDIDKHKYLVPKDLTVSQFIYVIRKRVKIKSEEALFLFINNNLQVSSHLMSNVYENNKDSDNFLYCLYQNESTFG